MNYRQLNNVLGHADLFLLDQILKGKFPEGSRILDAGCGEGRNLIYFFKNNYQVVGVDISKTAVDLAGRLARQYGAEERTHFEIADIARLPFPAQSMDAAICCSVLHFAKDERQFFSQAAEVTRVLKPGGLLFISMAAAFSEADMKTEERTVEGATFTLSRQAVSRLINDCALSWEEPLKLFSVDRKTTAILLLRKK